LASRRGKSEQRRRRRKCSDAVASSRSEGRLKVVRAVSSREGCEGGRRITSNSCWWNGMRTTDLKGTLATNREDALGYTGPGRVGDACSCWYAWYLLSRSAWHYLSGRGEAVVSNLNTTAPSVLADINRSLTTVSRDFARAGLGAQNEVTIR
jgi:hypothetical protein